MGHGGTGAVDEEPGPALGGCRSTSSDQGGSSTQDTPALTAAVQMGWGQWQRTPGLKFSNSVHFTLLQCQRHLPAPRPITALCQRLLLRFHSCLLSLSSQNREHSAPDLWQSLTRVAAPPSPQSSFWEAEVTLPTGLPGTQRGNDSAPTHPSAFPWLPAGAAHTAPREPPVPAVGGNPQAPQGRNPTRAPLLARGEGVSAPGSDGTTTHGLLKTNFI